MRSVIPASPGLGSPSLGGEGVRGRGSASSSERIARCLLLTTPPQLDQNETTDKGYINQGAVLRNRVALVERLYQEPPDAEVIML